MEHEIAIAIRDVGLAAAEAYQTTAIARAIMGSVCSLIVACLLFIIGCKLIPIARKMVEDIS